ncbi:IctB family putative bicarbonate transporter [Oxynema aestuarii]|uniref:Putative bicarbonate transporter, IctB family n=1 Tax=Oxynema aestuarii AP17 TaxID=2064643 RepID=A0A6H1U4F6_9CYAN|nr:IctB family putative bicarbonate transporter [Oxynema aestuarii]QIZ73752.1 putative bicarbonate transporter, IctB family [Oxynema aestuarii AP17]
MGGVFLPLVAFSSDLALDRWASGSWLHRIVGWLRDWRAGSWLMQWAEAIAVGLVALSFVLGPFVSTTLIGVLLLASGAYWALLTVSDSGESGFTPIHLMLFLYWGIATIATAMSPVKQAAFSGWVKLTLYLVLFLLMARVLRSPRVRSLLIAVYLHVATIVSVYGLRQWFFGAEASATWSDPNSPGSEVTRVYSYLGNPNLLAGYLLPAVMLSVAAIFMWRRTLPKALAVTMTAVNGACLILTFSRGGWIGLVVALFVLTLLFVDWWSVRLPEQWRGWAVPAVLGLTAATIVLAVALVEPIRDRVSTIFAGREDSSNNFRINVWEAVFEMIRDRPIIGIGPGNNAFNKIYPLYMRPKYTALSAYSIFLETAVEMGFIGLFALLWTISVTIYQGIVQLHRLRDRADPQGYWLMAALAIVAGMLAHGLVDTVWYRPQINILWWLAIAIVASFYRSSASSEGNNSAQRWGVEG